MYTINERILRVMSYYNLNINQFTKKIGYTNNTIIGKIVNNTKRKPSFDTLTAILRAFPDINRDWLLIGEGEMIGNIPKDGIKFYSVTLTPDNLKGEPQSYLKVTGFEDCDIAVTKHGKAMEPVFNVGDILLCQQAQKEFIVFGEAYLIAIKNMVMTRYVFDCDKKEMICLKAASDRYGDLTIEKSAIQDLYLIRGKISRL